MVKIISSTKNFDGFVIALFANFSFRKLGLLGSIFDFDLLL